MANKLEFEEKYKFSIAFENSSHAGYTTEKILGSFAAKTVPIYWGDPSICDVFNEKAFICVMNYASLNEVVERVREIDADNRQYMDMLKEQIFISEKAKKTIMVEALEKFLCNIFDQSKENAFRRNMICMGKSYQERYKEQVDAYGEKKKKDSSFLNRLKKHLGEYYG